MIESFVVRLRKEDPEQSGVHIPLIPTAAREAESWTFALVRLDSTHTSLEAAWKSSSPGVSGSLGSFNSHPRLRGLWQQMCILSEF